MGIKQFKSLLPKSILFILCFVLIMPATTAFAQTQYSNPDYDAISYILMDLQNGQVLAQNDPDRQVYPASTTKLMTALLLVEKKGLDGQTTVGKEINGMPSGSSLMNISVGEKVSVKDLLYGLLLCSGNDAACTIGTYVSGSVDAFVALMNQRAAELGMTHTHFVNPNGAFLNQDPTAPIPDEQLGIHHVTTASDMAKLTLEVAKHPEILQAGSTGAYTLAATNKHEARQIENANPLVHTPEKHPELSTYFYANATGLKTGTVSNIVVNNKTIRSYGNVVATASKNGLSLAALIYDDESLNDNGNSMMQSYKRWQLAADLFDYGFKTYAMVDIAPYLEADTLTRPIQAPSGAEQGDYKIASQNSTAEIKILLDSEDAQNLKNGTLKLDKQETIDDSLAPTVQTGDKVGSVQYTLSGNPVYKTDLVVTGKELAEVSAAPNSTPGQTGNTKASGGWPGWLLWVLIPGLAVAALFAVREINLYRRRHRRKRRYQGGMGGTEETTRRKL